MNIKKFGKVACILAAGTGSRLKSYTKNNTKCMVKVAGQPLIEKLISQIQKCNFDSIVIVVGYERQGLQRYLGQKFADAPITYVVNEKFASTNNIYSLRAAIPSLVGYGEIVIFESDIWVADNEALKFLLDDKLCNHALVSPYEYWMDGTCVILGDKKQISGFVSKTDVHRYQTTELYKTANWYRFSADLFFKYYEPFLNAYIAAKGDNSYYEDVLKIIAPFIPNTIFAYPIPPSAWMEIDDEEDLRRAEIIASENDHKKADELRSQFGGYWKNKSITDLTLLENPYFPTPEFWIEFNQIIPKAACSYPSKQSVMSKIFAKTIKVEARHVLVGNGASEIMMAVFKNWSDPVGIVAPYFLEYERIIGDVIKIIDRKFPEVGLWDSLAEWRKNPCSDLILVSPNNPTGEALNNQEIMELVGIASHAGRNIVVDESFSDFSDCQSSLMDSDILDAYPNLFVIKSLGKSYGIGGIRLGVLCSSNAKVMAEVEKSLPIWNVSSVAEVFLDLLPKYQREYRQSLKDIIQLRTRTESRLRELGVKYIPTQANFVLLRVNDDSSELADKVFFESGLLVKSINRASMDGCFLRLALKSDDAVNKALKVIENNAALFKF